MWFQEAMFMKKNFAAKRTTWVVEGAKPKLRE
jgi:hypothetical protein